MTAIPILQLRSLTKTFGALAAVDNIDLDFHEGEFFTIVGPSGSGKTTLLRMLTGMEIATQRRHPAARQAHQRPAGQQAADLHGVPVAGAVSASHGRPEHRVLAEDEGRRSGDAQGPCAGADDAVAAAAEPTMARTSPNVPAASGSAWRWPGRSPTNPTSCSSTSRFRPSTTSSGRRWRRNSRTFTGRPARPSSTSPTAWKRLW